MSSKTEDFEKLGQFYLGKEYDLEKKEICDDLLMYDSKDLVTHGVVLGMTGSGKTGLCIALLEEAAMDNVPAIVIDPKGDISNLMLTFPELDAKSFEPWVNPDDAAKKGISVKEHAEKTAGMWKEGLAEWGQGPERIAQFQEKVDINVFTPGSNAGAPVSILSSLDAPPSEVMEDVELFGERIESTASSLLSLVGVDADPIKSPEAVYISKIFEHEWVDGRGLDLPTLIQKIVHPPFDKIGIFDVDTFLGDYKGRERGRQTLALKFNNLLASPGFSIWLEGAKLDVAHMLHREDGKPRISVFSIAHLGDAERMFFVSLLLNQMLGWMRTQRGTTSLRAMLYMDEIYGFLPPTANPPSKRPMMTMLKQGRAFGLGCLLATQNPVDLDYKALSNIGTWFLGRLQTERDKMRVIDGLEGAVGSQNANFDRKQLEILLSGLGNRVFLMNNVHEDGPVLFHVRWVMSYLTGPLARDQIKGLMDPKRGDLVADTLDEAVGFKEPDRVLNGTENERRPMVGEGVLEVFGTPNQDEGYFPYLFREGSVRFSLAKANVEESRSIRRGIELGYNGVDYERFCEIAEAELKDRPIRGLKFTELPAYAMSKDFYKKETQKFKDELYRNEREEIFFCPMLKVYGKIGESEADFRVRISHEAREERDEAMEKIRDAAEKKLKTLEGRLRTAEARVSKEKAEAGSAKMQAGISILGSVMKAIFGRKIGSSGFGRATSSSSVTKATTAYKQHRDVAAAEDKVEGIVEDIEAIREELEKEIEDIKESHDPSKLELEKETLKPTRADVQVERVGLVWK